MDNDAGRRPPVEGLAASLSRGRVAGDGRVLLRARDGGVQGYDRDEVGFVRAGSGPIVTSAAGMLVLTLVFAIFAVGSVVLVVAPVSRGGDPWWAALPLTLGAMCGAVYAGRLARAEFRAKRVRAERGVPEPSSRQLDF